MANTPESARLFRKISSKWSRNPHIRFDTSGLDDIPMQQDDGRSAPASEEDIIMQEHLDARRHQQAGLAELLLDSMFRVLVRRYDPDFLEPFSEVVHDVRDDVALAGLNLDDDRWLWPVGLRFGDDVSAA